MNVTDVVGGNKLGVAARQEDSARNTAEKVLQQSTEDVDAFVRQIHSIT